MRRSLILCMLLIFGISLIAQIPVINRVKNRAKKQAAERVERQANQTIDKGLDKLEDALFGKKSNSADSTTSSQDAASASSTVDTISQTVPDTNTVPARNVSPFELSKSIEPFENQSFGNGNSPEGILGKGPFGLASAKVIQKMRSKTLQSMEVMQYDTLSFVDFGMRSFRAQRQIQSVNMLGIKNQQTHNAHIFTLGDSIYNIDPVAKSGVKMLNPSKQIYEGMSEADLRDFEDQVEADMNTEPKLLGTDMVAGQLCAVYDFETYDENDQLIFVSRIWFYKGFMLKSRSRGFGSEIEMETLYFEENPRITNDLFRLDPSIKFSSFSFPFGQ